MDDKKYKKLQSIGGAVLGGLVVSFGIVQGGMRTYLAVQNTQHQSALTQIKHNPLNFAGYIENTDPEQAVLASPWPAIQGKNIIVPVLESGSMPQNHQAIMENKRAMDQALEQCSQDPSACSPGLRGYMEMIDVVKAIKAPSLQAGIINGWVNLAVQYDSEQRGAAVPWSRSIKDAVMDGRGICSEQAELKHYALNKVGFKEEDNRLVYGYVLGEGDKANGHAVVLARAGEDNWLLNNNEFWLGRKDYTYSANTIAMVIDDHAGMRTDFRSIGQRFFPMNESTDLDGGSFTKSWFVPMQSYTYSAAMFYQHVMYSAEGVSYNGPPIAYKRPSKDGGDFVLSTRLKALLPGQQAVVKRVMMKALDLARDSRERPAEPKRSRPAVSRSFPIQGPSV